MTVRIHINIEADTAVEAREQMARLLGTTTLIVGHATESKNEYVPVEDAMVAEEGGFVVAKDEGTFSSAPAVKRERGQPSPGKARRTKAEIAEDEAADKVDAERVTQGVADRAISTTLEDRQDPEAVDSPEDAAQDAADEAAESAAQRGDDTTLTLEDLRDMMGKYASGYGMGAAMADLPIVFAEVCGDGVVKATQVPEAQYGALIDAIKKAGKENRFKREAAVADG